MKKIFTLLTACSLGLVANSQIYFADDFEGGSLTGNSAWTVQSVSNPNAIIEWEYGTFSGSGFAKCSNWDGTNNNVIDSWLISPSFNLSTATTTEMSFDMTKRYGSPGDDIKVMISTNYSGTGLPSTATWVDITNLFTLDADNTSWTFVGSGIGDISTYNVANVYIAFQYTGTATDGSTWEIDNVLIQENGTVAPPPTITSIYDIQFTTATSGDSPELGNILTTRGVVTGVFQIGSGAGTFFIQDGDGAWNGIYVYESATTVAVGDSVFVTGKVLEFNNLTEIGSVTDITIINSGNTLPTPATVTGTTYANEDYEGVLVTIVDGINTLVTDGFGVWTVNDGANALIDDDCMAASFTSTLGNAYTVIGVSHLSFGEYKIYPRNQVNDIVTTGFASIEENNTNYSIFPNPATDNVTISGIENGTVTVYAVTGEVVYGGKVNGTISINLEDLNTGIYMIEVIENDVKSNFKLVVE